LTSTCDVRLSWSVRTERCFARRGFSASSLSVSRASTPRADHAAEARVLRRERSGAVASSGAGAPASSDVPSGSAAPSGATPPPLAALLFAPPGPSFPLGACFRLGGRSGPRARSAALRASIAPVAPVSAPCPPVTAASTARSSSLVSSKARRCESLSRGASSRGAFPPRASPPPRSSTLAPASSFFSRRRSASGFWSSGTAR
jgi:hypothetical protein